VSIFARVVGLSWFNECLRRINQVFKDSRLKQTIGPCIDHDRFFSPCHDSVTLHHLRDTRPRTIAPDKRVAQFTHDARDSSIMDVRIRSAEVAERSVDPIPLGFADKPCVKSWIEFGPGDSQAKFKRHVESRDAWSSSRDLDAGQVMDRISTALNELKYSIEPPLTSRDTQRDSRLQTELDEANYIGEIRPLEFFVVRYVEEDRVLGNR